MRQGSVIEYTACEVNSDLHSSKRWRIKWYLRKIRLAPLFSSRAETRHILFLSLSQMMSQHAAEMGLGEKNQKSPMNLISPSHIWLLPWRIILIRKRLCQRHYSDSVTLMTSTSAPNLILILFYFNSHLIESEIHQTIPTGICPPWLKYFFFFFFVRNCFFPYKSWTTGSCCSRNELLNSIIHSISGLIKSVSKKKYLETWIFSNVWACVFLNNCSRQFTTLY